MYHDRAARKTQPSRWPELSQKILQKLLYDLRIDVDLCSDSHQSLKRLLDRALAKVQRVTSTPGALDPAKLSR